MKETHEQDMVLKQTGGPVGGRACCATLRKAMSPEMFLRLQSNSHRGNASVNTPQSISLGEGFNPFLTFSY